MLTPSRRFGLFLLYYIVEESIEIKTHKINYFTNVSNWLDLVVIGVRNRADMTGLFDLSIYLSCQFSDFGCANLLHRLSANANP